MNNIGIDYETVEAFRLGGVGWIFAFFIVAATILAGRWMLGWQMRRIERKFPGYLEPRADSQGTDKSKAP
jgi:hypothetical protein